MDDRVSNQTMDNEVVLKMGRIIKLSDDMAEVIVDEGVVIDMDMVQEYHTWIEDNLSDPCMLLVNKINPYTYTFEAQKEIATLDKIKAMAVVVYNRISEVTTRDLASFPREREWHIQIFDSRHDALSWLESQRQS
ncbi:MAG: hypothetical protein OQL09_08485 [Gammaproteobacteria bacterium]|nr:hypothetical protein [Gammaproteobacteria bacterium]